MKKEKKSKPSKELPLGFVDRKEKELLIRDFVISNIKEVMIKYGFQYLETPSFEYTDSIGKFLPDKDRPDQGVFSFKDENKWLSLRYDLTAPLARYVAKNFLEIPKPFKRYQLGTVWRNEKPGPGRFREFLQFDADFIGTNNLMADAELCVMISEVFKSCGLSENEFTIKFSSRKILEQMLDYLDITSTKTKLVILRSLDKVDRLGWDEVKKLLGSGRKDKSGDYTKGANLDKNKIDKLLSVIKFDDQDKFDFNKWKEKWYQGPAFLLKGSAYKEISELNENFESFGLKNIKFDPTIIRGLEYYTGPIFEANLNFKIKNSKQQIIEFGAVGGGGRYDSLVNNFGNYDCPATGISIGIDRLVFALMQKKDFKTNFIKPVIICVFDKRNNKEYIKILNKLRASDISSEIYSGEGKLKKQMEYANKIQSPCVIFYGDDEIKKSEVKLKNLKTGEESSVKIEDMVDEIKKFI